MVALAMSAAVAFASPHLRRRLIWLTLGALLLVWLSLAAALLGIVDRTSDAILTPISARRPQHVESAAEGALTVLLSLGGPALLVTVLGLWAIKSSKLLPQNGKVRLKSKLTLVRGPGKDLDDLRVLFAEYARVESIVSMSSPDFKLELLPGPFGAPDGMLWMSRVKGQPAACVAGKRSGPGTCELSRLYVRAPYRHVGLARELTERACEEAKKLGYSHVRLRA
ncbi:MAG: GNAT family N-acetyltransferase, partial [Deltaproteobacteria bacterium]|nr:GNAT family N-acetyltransferase [Deltaproteobacteria bacterium]